MSFRRSSAIIIYYIFLSYSSWNWKTKRKKHRCRTEKKHIIFKNPNRLQCLSVLVCVCTSVCPVERIIIIFVFYFYYYFFSNSISSVRLQNTRIPLFVVRQNTFLPRRAYDDFSFCKSYVCVTIITYCDVFLVRCSVRVPLIIIYVLNLGHTETDKHRRRRRTLVVYFLVHVYRF